MKIKFREEYNSIKPFNPVDLPDFTILTGLNGSGKTQLLEALNTGKITIESIIHTDVVYFNNMTFVVNPESHPQPNQITAEINSGWDFLKGRGRFLVNIQGNQGMKNVNTVLLDLKNECLNDNDCKKLKDISTQKNKPLFLLDKKDIEDDQLYPKFTMYKQNTIDCFSDPGLNNSIGNSIKVLLKKIPFFIDEIERKDFDNMYLHVSLANNFLPTQIGKIFTKYRKDEYDEYYKAMSKAEDNAIKGEIKKYSEEKCLNRYGGSTPWNILNDMLKRFSGIDYAISYPPKINYDEFPRTNEYTFVPKLESQSESFSIDYQHLSSGEKIIFALALCLFKTKSDNLFPKLLLLDEIDSALHPSQIKNLFGIINDVFLQNDTKVILTTHSPTTIALAPEESIFIVNKKGPNRIEKSDKDNALKILTEGVATLEKGLKLFDQISKNDLSIITEGNNVDYIKKAIDLFAPDKKDRIDVITGFEHKGGKGELKILFNFFAIAKPDNKVLFVWDRDFGTKIEEKNNTFGFVFGKNESNKLEKNTGIECQFDHKYTENYVLKTTDTDGTLESTHFKGNKKQEFKDHILANYDENSFKNFKPLVERISKLLDSNV